MLKIIKTGLMDRTLFFLIFEPGDAIYPQSSKVDFMSLMYFSFPYVYPKNICYFVQIYGLGLICKII